MIGIMKDSSRTRVTQAVLLDRLYDNSNPSKLQSNRMVNKKNLFISPELYGYINTKDKSKTMYGRQKNDFFGLGMSLLQIGTNNRQKLQQVYKPKGQFDHTLLGQFMSDFDRLHGLDPVLCKSESEYLGLKKAPVNVEERKFMEKSEETVVHPSNGQPSYKQTKVKKAEFAKNQQETQWRQISSWRTVNTTYQDIPKQVIKTNEVVQNNEEIVVMNTPGYRPVQVMNAPVHKPVQVINAPVHRPVQVHQEVKGR